MRKTGDGDKAATRTALGSRRTTQQSFVSARHSLPSAAATAQGIASALPGTSFNVALASAGPEQAREPPDQIE